MPGKSRQGKGRHRTQGKKRKTPQIYAATVAPEEPVSQPKVPAPAKSVPTPAASVTGVRYPYVVTELRRIGILAGIMVAIMVVLVLFLD